MSPFTSSVHSAREIAAFGTELTSAYTRTSAARARILDVQAARLRAVLDAAARVRLYGHPQRRALGDFAPLTKQHLIDHLDESVADPRLSREALMRFVAGDGAPGQLMHGQYLVATTSGTTGQVGVYVDHVEGWARQRAVVFARMFQGLLTPKGFALLTQRRYRLGFIVATGGHLLTALLAGRVPRMGRLVAQSKVVSIDASLGHIVGELNAYQPLLLHTYPTFLEVLAGEQRRGALHIEPELLTVGSEPVSQQCRDAVARAFPSARLVETYAATECLAMAVACPLGALHVNEDACILEPVDDDLRPVAHGVEAPRVLVTNLLNRVQPLVRYELTDALVLDDAPCPCGSPFLRARVFGRTDDTFFLVDGQGRAQVHPPIPIECAFLGTPGLFQYQLVHERQNELKLTFVADGAAAPGSVRDALQERLRRYLEEHGLLPHVQFSLMQVDQVQRHPRSKKLRQIMSEAPRPALPTIASSQAREASQRSR